MNEVLWIIRLIFLILIFAATLEVFTISKRQRKLEEKIDEISKDLKELLK